MSKKGKKKSSWDGGGFGWGSAVGGGKKDKRDKNHGRWDDEYGRGPELTLGKEAARESAAIIRKPVKIPEAFVRNQEVCNHAGKRVTIADFMGECQSPQAMVPMLSRLVDRFGEGNVCLCARCYSPLVDPSVIEPAKVDEAIDMLYAASNAAAFALGMSKKDVAHLGKAREELLESFGKVPAMIQYISSGNGDGGSPDEDDLNSNFPGSF